MTFPVVNGKFRADLCCIRTLSTVRVSLCFPVNKRDIHSRFPRNFGNSTGGSCVDRENANWVVRGDDDRRRNVTLESRQCHFLMFPVVVVISRCLFRIFWLVLRCL